MKKIIVVWVVLLGLVLSGCGKTKVESTKTSPQSSGQNTKTTETTSHSSEQKTKPAVKLIEFTFQKNAWGSMDQAIDFYENTYKNKNNAIANDIIWENYRRNLWSIVKEGTSGNTITLHWSNISGAGGSFDQFVKNNDGTTLITFFDGNVGYPNHSTERYTVRNSDYKVIKTEDLFLQ